MLYGIAFKEQEDKQQLIEKLIEKYDQMVELCRPKTAVALIKKQLLSKKIAFPQTPPSAVAAIDKQILEALGWDKGENRILYNAKLELKTKTPTVSGLFSTFCFHERKFARFMFQRCQTDYICILNWTIILAFRLVKKEPEKYTDENIVELIQNLHKTLFGDIFAGSSYFVSLFVSESKNTTFYADKVKDMMSSQIFDDVTLQPLVLGIKREIQAISETTAIDLRVRNTSVQLRGGMKTL